MQDEWRPDLYYYVIGKAVPGEVLFLVEAHYRRFLRRYLRDRLTLVFQVYGYCLLPNHFHLLVRPRFSEEIRARLAGPKALAEYQRAFLYGESSWSEFVAATFNAAINGYAQYFNKQVGRRGQLFVKPTLHGLAEAEAAYLWSSMRAPKYYITEPEIELHWGGETSCKAFQVEYLRQYGARMLDYDEEEFFRSLTPRRYVEAEAQWAVMEEAEARKKGLR